MTAALDPAHGPTIEERAARGKAARAAVPRSGHGGFVAAADRPDPVGLLEQQATTRVPELVPIRYGRMSANPFAFYRGGAFIMATDLAAMASSGLQVQLCGDAHLANFGGFASPERSMVFDINDFDETHPGPFEWDVMRLAASIEIAGRNRSFDKKVRAEAVTRMTRAYRLAMRKFADMNNLDVWYEHLDVDMLMAAFGREVGSKALKQAERNVAKAQTKDRLKALAKLTTVVDGQLRFRSDPPLLVPIEEVFSEVDATEIHRQVHEVISAYSQTLALNRRHLLDTYELVHVARKVVGVGSVGTRAWVALLVGRDNDDPLFLQVKQAEASVLEPFLGRSVFENHGQRVVAGQSLMQTASDIFLGWQRAKAPDGVDRDFYVRQLWDWKASADLETMSARTLQVYSEMCGWTLARGHARSGDRVAIASYLGAADTLDRAMTKFASAYADQNERDHQGLVEAIASGRVAAELGV